MQPSVLLRQDLHLQILTKKVKLAESFIWNKSDDTLFKYLMFQKVSIFCCLDKKLILSSQSLNLINQFRMFNQLSHSVCALGFIISLNRQLFFLEVIRLEN